MVVIEQVDSSLLGRNRRTSFIEVGEKPVELIPKDTPLSFDTGKISATVHHDEADGTVVVRMHKVWVTGFATNPVDKFATRGRKAKRRQVLVKGRNGLRVTKFVLPPQRPLQPHF